MGVDHYLLTAFGEVYCLALARNFILTLVGVNIPTYTVELANEKFEGRKFSLKQLPNVQNTSN